MVFGLGPDKFSGFSAADFDAFVESKWSSNRFNMERMKVAGKLAALGKVIGPALEAAGFPLESETSQANPTIFNGNCVDSGWLYFQRRAQDRKMLAALLDKHNTMAKNVADACPHHQHIILFVRVDRAGIEAGLRIHHNAWLDGHNLFDKLKDTWQHELFLGLIAGLSTDLTIDFGTFQTTGGSKVDRDELKRAAQAFGNPTESLLVVQRFGRDHAEIAEPAFAEQLQRLLTTLAPLYQFIAWSKENDHVSIKDQLPAQASPELVSLSSVIEKKARQKKAGIKDLSLAPQRKVVVLKGVFERQKGVVDSIDSKGVAKVLIGNLAVKIPASDLKVVD
ncbi:MAG: hypothetical protein KC609_09225 [Myxococcales bacterium]|nr:hypothetical protein [Myxococcales bacterium]